MMCEKETWTQGGPSRCINRATKHGRCKKHQDFHPAKCSLIQFKDRNGVVCLEIPCKTDKDAITLEQALGAVILKHCDVELIP